MAKRLSEQLADLSVRAKNVEDAFGAAQKEAREKLETRKEEARAAARNAIESGSRNPERCCLCHKGFQHREGESQRRLDALKADVQRAKHKLDVKVAEKHAEDSEWEAGFAIDYAIASIEQAKFAVLDAVDARQASEQAKRAPAA